MLFHPLSVPRRSIVNIVPELLCRERASAKRAVIGIEVALGAVELWCPNIARSAQCEQCHPDTARLYHHHALAPAEGEPSDPDDTSLGHCRADHPERLDRDRTIGMEIIRAVEIDRIDTDTRYELLQVDNL